MLNIRIMKLVKTEVYGVNSKCFELKEYHLLESSHIVVISKCMKIILIGVSKVLKIYFQNQLNYLKINTIN